MTPRWPISRDDPHANVKGVLLGLAITFVLAWIAWIVSQAF
jgi:hypothetical protein